MRGRWVVDWRRAALLAALALVLGSCDRAAPEEATETLPTGAWLYGDAEALRVVLDGVSQLRGTSAARAAQQARQRVASCVEIIAHAERASGLLAELRCVEGSPGPPEPLRKLRADQSLAWLMPTDGQPGTRPGTRSRWRGTAQVAADGAIRASLSMAPARDGDRGLARLLVPGKRGAGPTRLATQDSLIHARLRPADGLDVASAIAAGGQADRLFRLASTLFTGAALVGTWELAVYPPEPGQLLPPIALGLELALPEAARAGVDRLVADLEAAWPIRQREARFELGARGEIQGACFFELRILPEFAPCWAIRDDLLAVGWNAASLQRALGESSVPPAPLDGVVLSLDRWPAAERTLGGDAAAYPWQRIELAARATGDEIVLALRAAKAPRP